MQATVVAHNAHTSGASTPVIADARFVVTSEGITQAIADARNVAHMASKVKLRPLIHPQFLIAVTDDKLGSFTQLVEGYDVDSMN